MRPCPWRIPDTRSPHSGCKRGPAIRIRIRSTSTTPCVPIRARYPPALSRRSSPDPIPPEGVSRHPWSGTKDSSLRSCPSDAVRAPSRSDSAAYGISILSPSPKLYHKTCREVPGTRRQPRHFRREAGSVMTAAKVADMGSLDRFRDSRLPLENRLNNFGNLFSADLLIAE